MNNLRKMLLLPIFMLFVVFIISGCQSDTGVSPALNGVGNGNTTLAIQSQTSDINHVTITSAKILFKDLNCESQGAAASVIAEGPIPVVLFLDGRVANFVVGNIAPGSYDRINFLLHKPSHGEQVSDPEFMEGNQGYSVIVSGSFNQQPFTYKSRITARMRLQFSSPLVVTESSKIRIVMVISPQLWFLKNGDFLDPNEPQNRNRIDQNIKDSFRWVYVEE